MLFFRKALTGLAVRILSLSSKVFFLLEEANLLFDYDFFLEDSAFWVLVTGLISKTNERLLSSPFSSSDFKISMLDSFYFTKTSLSFIFWLDRYLYLLKLSILFLRASWSMEVKFGDEVAATKGIFFYTKFPYTSIS